MSPRAIAPALAIACACACFIDAGPQAAGGGTRDGATGEGASETLPATGSTTGATAVDATLTGVSSSSSGDDSTTPAMTTGATSGCGASPWYGDSDGDGWGDERDVMWTCARPPGYAPEAGDCDDGDPGIHPDADERCDLYDNDCDGLIDEWAPTLESCGACTLFEHGDGTYWVCGSLASWMSARVACQERGGDLAMLTSADENDAVTAWLTSGDAPYWIGMTDIVREGVWTWLDGQPLLPGYVNWNAGEPNDFNTGEDCGELAASGRWNDQNCLGLRGFVCEASLAGA